MHKELLEAYKVELQFLRELGSEFAQAHPQTAHALGLDSDSASDPFVERLLEGVAFLTAKTACRLNHEYGRFTHDLIQAVMPDLLCPLPPAAMLELRPLTALSKGSQSLLPKGSPLRYTHASFNDIGYMTAADVELAPVQIEGLTLLGPEETLRISEISRQRFGLKLGDSQRLLRLDLSSMAGQVISDVMPSELKLFCSGSAGPWLWQALTQHCQAVVIADPKSQMLVGIHNQSQCHAACWEDDEALLPIECVIPGPYRLLREWSYWPERFLFASLNGLDKAIKPIAGAKLQLLFCLSAEARLPQKLPEMSLRLFCVPVVNLKHITCEPIALTPTEHEYTVKLPYPYKNHRISQIDNVKLRDKDGRWKQLEPAGFLKSSQNETTLRQTYALRQEARWQQPYPGQESNKIIHWKISPGVSIPFQTTYQFVLNVSAWVSHGQADQVEVRLGNAWHFDCSAPVQEIIGICSPSDRNSLPYDSKVLLDLSCFRFDALTRLNSIQLKLKLQKWLCSLGSQLFSGTFKSCELKSCVRQNPWIVPRSLAQGWQLNIEVDEESSLNPLLAMWAKVLSLTLCQQLHSDKFIECVCIFNQKTLAISRVWR